MKKKVVDLTLIYFGVYEQDEKKWKKKVVDLTLIYFHAKMVKNDEIRKGSIYNQFWIMR